MIWLWHKPLTLALETKTALDSGNLGGEAVPSWINACLPSSAQITDQPGAQRYIDKALDELTPLLVIMILFYVTVILAICCFYGAFLIPLIGLSCEKCSKKEVEEEAPEAAAD